MLGADGRWDEALAAYQATLQISPNRFNILARAGLTAERGGKEAEARVHYARLLVIAGGARPFGPRGEHQSPQTRW
jgi:hypothetical protein